MSLVVRIVAKLMAATVTFGWDIHDMRVSRLQLASIKERLNGADDMRMRCRLGQVLTRTGSNPTLNGFRVGAA